MTLIVAMLLAFADLGPAKAEPDLEKRAQLALTNADHAIDDARAAYKAGEESKLAAALAEVRESVDLAYTSLQDTNKAARRARSFKHAEQRTHNLARRLASLSDEISVDDRKAVEEVRGHVQEVHDQLLAQIMGRKK
jgi:hypothetical protein